MELPELPIVLNWIFKLLAITVVIYLSKKYHAEITESASYFHFEVWICVMIAAAMVVPVSTLLIFYNDHSIGNRIFEILHLAIKLSAGLLMVLVISRVVYKKLFIQNPV